MWITRITWVNDIENIFEHLFTPKNIHCKIICLATLYIILPWFCKTDSIKIRNIKPLKVRRPSTRSKTIFCGVPGICFSGKEDHRGPPNQNDHVHFWRSSLHRSNQFQSNDRQCSTALCIPNENLFKINSSHGVLSRHFPLEQSKSHHHIWVQNCQNIHNDPAWQIRLFASGGKRILGHGDPPETWRPNRASFSIHVHVRTGFYFLHHPNVKIQWVCKQPHRTWHIFCNQQTE